MDYTERCVPCQDSGLLRNSRSYAISVIKSEKDAEKYEEDKEAEENEEGEECSSDSEIEILIHNVENFIREGNASLKFLIKHDGKLLGESKVIKFESTLGDPCKKHTIDFSAGLCYNALCEKSVASIVSSPVLIEVLEYVQVPRPVQTPNKKNKKGPARSSISIKSVEQIVTLGICNIDLLPVVLGEETLSKKKLILDTPVYSWDESAVPWQCLPRIAVSVIIPDNPSILQDISYNVLNITIESLFNLPSYFARYMRYKCETTIQTCENVSDARITFETGKWVDYPDVEGTKKWKRLQNIDGRGSFSKYKIDFNYGRIKNDFKDQFCMKEATKKNVPRIQWNTMHRLLMNENDSQSLKWHINKYRKWNLKILVDESEEGQENSEQECVTVYQCEVDISQLLFPGNKTTRVLAQLYQLIDEPESEEALRHVGSFCRESKISANSNEAGDYTEEGYQTRKDPLFTESGKPVLILVEFEVFKPLIIPRDLEEFTDAFEKLKDKKVNRDLVKLPYTTQLVEENYDDCVKYLFDFINENYKDFKESMKKEDSKNGSEMSESCESSARKFSSPDELSRFQKHLHDSGKYCTMRNILKKRIANLVEMKFPDRYNIDSKRRQEMATACYTYLIEKMHAAINTKINVCADEMQKHAETPKVLWFRAEEAYEAGDQKKADKLYAKIVVEATNDPDSWIMYATNFVRSGKLDEAIECCRESIRLSDRHKIALTFYGILLMMKNKYDEAEIFLKAATHFYPRFVEGWALLHLFYIQIHYNPGIDITLQLAEDSLRDRKKEIEPMFIFKEEPMIWCAEICHDDRVFLLTANFLLRLNLYDIAGLALAQDICHTKKSIAFLYFSSVVHYLQRDYTSSLKSLQETELLIGPEYCVAALKGHCDYQLGNFEKSLEQYEIADMLHKRPDDIHLVHLRMGSQLIDNGDYKHALDVFLRACKSRPTCKTWLGVGISCYNLKEYDKSELALMEANSLDPEDAEVWGYLCLLNIALNRPDEFDQCYTQTIKLKLENRQLMNVIKDKMMQSGFAIPIIEC
ncbi:cilia- and flagella-associated protein 70-like [Trichogramma pretiosum]|uniref:cilia- and flagella-associated protein 70-like n=1 Tax=Trichogramma pretiosum TaxID=7493 RepID=UPI000C718D32|nr:cilia- and flagella-associated protein 70-like [Trichogramma pretiosum]